ncbi:hypothetical protein AVEN_92972-1 [Araneus ventricosus]|uniref:Uncharacterized protein n=1 Tax=Araneus ventricosus TaxID=182803 RepID=A0A4Y2VPK4_ARAVE|nr:hypothetical protein AVEN_92972-1 [Araneus ventricosus]
MEDEQTDNDDNSKNGDVSDSVECVLSLQKSLTVLEEKSGKVSGINVEESLTADDDLMFFEGVRYRWEKIFRPKSQTKWKMMIKRTMMIQINRNH